MNQIFPGDQVFATIENNGRVLATMNKSDFASKDDVVRAFAERLRALDVQKIYTGHCTGDRAYGILRDVLGERAEQMHTGMTIEI